MCALHEMLQQTVSYLLTDSHAIVKQTLIESGITKLCQFFGRQKGMGDICIEKECIYCFVLFFVFCSKRSYSVAYDHIPQRQGGHQSAWILLRLHCRCGGLRRLALFRHSGSVVAASESLLLCSFFVTIFQIYNSIPRASPIWTSSSSSNRLPPRPPSAKWDSSARPVSPTLSPNAQPI